jgi:hypothetical protein
MRKDKNYSNTRGAGDGDLTAGLLGMMQGGGAMEYPSMMQNGGSLTNQQKASLVERRDANESTSQFAKMGKEKMSYQYGGGKGDMSRSRRDYMKK